MSDEAKQTTMKVEEEIKPGDGARSERQGQSQKRVLNMIWANEAGVSVYVYEGEHDRRVIEIHGVVNDYEAVLATATIEKHNRDSFAEVVGLDVQKWKRRAEAFQEGYRDKSFEVTGLEIQLMDLRAHGADKVTARQNESLRTKLLAACIERNEARAAVSALSKALAAAVHAMRSYQHGNASPDLADSIDASASAALALVDGSSVTEGETK